ncbi:MAG TPA: hypothetical protein VNK24_02750 [Elusimicrobiota bacterium]|nr:hypothetical protein [Elusimicrobiota bacterium]
MGTPLIGKMQNGIFYQFHVLYYFSSARWRPWAFTAVPFLIQTFAFACLYLFARLLGLAELHHREDRWRAFALWLLPPATALAFFAGAQVMGVLLAAVQILPGMEYVRWSYNRVWRTRPEFGWIYHTIEKHLGLSDIPLLVLGLDATASELFHGEMISASWRWARSSNSRLRLFPIFSPACLS